MNFFTGFLLCAIFVSANPFIACSQNAKNIQFHGVIRDGAWGQPLAYASIGIANTPVGTISDSLGHFNLLFGNEHLSDSIGVSMVGYYPVKIPVSELAKVDRAVVIKLTKKIIQLNEVVVSNKFQQTVIVGRQSNGALIQASIIPKGEKTPIVGAESGLKIQVKHYPALLSNFNFCLTANNFKYTKFRVNVYSLKNNLPDTLLFNKEIFVDIRNFKTGWNQVDLTAYDIVVTSDFAITLQWVDCNRDMAQEPKILVPGTLSFSHTCYFRTASLDKWSSAKMNFSFYATMRYWEVRAI